AGLPDPAASPHDGRHRRRLAVGPVSEAGEYRRCTTSYQSGGVFGGTIRVSLRPQVPEPRPTAHGPVKPAAHETWDEKAIGSDGSPAFGDFMGLMGT
ncbi:hypothetical protein, partial [Streptomyces niveus]|uniref:hypothetical protein n=1 Tax=Streptomyces niveus TaxID=193462 RepID=UPI003D06A883